MPLTAHYISNRCYNKRLRIDNLMPVKLNTSSLMSRPISADVGMEGLDAVEPRRR